MQKRQNEFVNVSGMHIQILVLLQYQHFNLDTNSEFSITVLNTEMILEPDMIRIQCSIPNRYLVVVGFT